MFKSRLKRIRELKLDLNPYIIKRDVNRFASANEALKSAAENTFVFIE